jgi:hypothetical protein
MQDAVRVSPMNDIVGRCLKPIERRLRTGDPAATLDRLFRSQHVQDLRLIVVVALIAVALIFFVGLLLTFESELVKQLEDLRKSKWAYIRIVFAAASTFLAFFVPVLAVFGAVVAWAYRVGSARLGVVDLFACEISTLCRVATVMDTVRRYVDRFEHGPPTERADGPPVSAHEFTSQENYFPVFEGNARDLQALEAPVVINITAFYTYMKAVRDSLRALSATRPLPAELVSPPSEAAAGGPWHEAVRNVIYMLFLGLESARYAIADLVEFEPESAERTIVILISELEAYRFLRRQFPDEEDMHYQRIALRYPKYRDLMPTLCRSVVDGKEGKKEPQPPWRWEPAWRLLPELQKRFEAAMSPIDP